ncbi:MAG TPA: hypothetical protein VMY37_14110 [Thermoguttaceae bacterium]|nr:hypothetical protein [Thermoguttaceae bacterium]
MRALTKIASVAALLATLAVLPATLIAISQMADQVAAAIPHHASALEQAEFWARAFGS